MTHTISKTTQRIRRKLRIRAKISGTSSRPRLAVFKSNTHISAQLIDDTQAKTIASAHSKTTKGETLSLKAFAVGKAIALSAKAKNIETVVFDRGGFIYTGNIKAVADGAREGGLIF
jgi:large subunit ribosomal protein L18